MKTSRVHPFGSRSRARGLTLIELMISLVLGMVLVGGVLVVFLGSRTTYSTTDNLSKMQDSARIAFTVMGREIRESTGTGCGNGSRSDNAIAKRNESILNAAQSATPAWWSVIGQGIQGYEAGVASAAVAIGTAVGERTNGTDAIQVSGAYGAGFTVDVHDNLLNKFTLNTNASGLNANDILIVCDYKQSTIFQASAVATNKISYAAGTGSTKNCGTALGYDPANSCPTVYYQYDPLVTRMTRFGASYWYIGNGTNGRPSLYRIFLTGTPEEISPGVSDMQITYLQDGIAAYQKASDITDWGKILAVRLTLSFESQDQGVSTASSGDRRIGTATTSTILLRNRTL